MSRSDDNRCSKGEGIRLSVSSVVSSLIRRAFGCVRPFKKALWKLTKKRETI